METSSHSKLAFQAILSRLNWNTPVVKKGLKVKQIGIKKGINCFGVIFLRGYKVGSV